jgi:hypothetical protein
MSMLKAGRVSRKEFFDEAWQEAMLIFVRKGGQPVEDLRKIFPESAPRVTEVARNHRFPLCHQERLSLVFEDEKGKGNGSTDPRAAPTDWDEVGNDRWEAT